MRFESLTSRGDFARAASAPRRKRDGLVVHVAPSQGAGVTRVGLAVGRSAGSAVRRNRIRRRVRAALRTLPEMSPRDVLVRADGSLASRNFQELRSDLAHLLDREPSS